MLQVTPKLAPPKFQSGRVIGALILREMGSTYGQSPGGYVWAIASPLGSILMMSLAFSLLVHSPALGKSFLLFYATGFLPFAMFSDISAKIGRSVRYSKALLSYPRVTWIEAVIARFVLNTCTQSVTFCIIIPGIFIVENIHANIEVLPIVSGMAMMAMLGLGVGLCNCFLIGYFPVWHRIWEIISRPIMIASGIFYLPDDLSPAIRDLLWWNPIIHGVSQVRAGFYDTYHPQILSPVYGYASSMIMICIALVFLRRGYLNALDG